MNIPRLPSDLEAENARLRAENERLRARLEMDRVHTLDGKTVPADLPEHMDGIACRDETIRQLDRRVEHLLAANERLRPALRTTVAALARKEGLSMHATKELMEGRWHPDVQWTAHPALETARAALEAKP